MAIIIPEWPPKERDPEMSVGEVRERAARAIADVMFARRNGRTMMAWEASPERGEALAYVDAVLKALQEPSEAMIAAGRSALKNGPYESRFDEAKAVYSDMLSRAAE